MPQKIGKNLEFNRWKEINSKPKRALEIVKLMEKEWK